MFWRPITPKISDFFFQTTKQKRNECHQIVTKFFKTSAIMFKDPTHFVEIPLYNQEFKGLFVPIREIKDDYSVYWLYAPANVSGTGTIVISR